MDMGREMFSDPEGAAELPSRAPPKRIQKNASGKGRAPRARSAPPSGVPGTRTGSSAGARGQTSSTAGPPDRQTADARHTHRSSAPSRPTRARATTRSAHRVRQLARPGAHPHRAARGHASRDLCAVAPVSPQTGSVLETGLLFIPAPARGSASVTCVLSFRPAARGLPLGPPPFFAFPWVAEMRKLEKKKVE